MTHWISVKDALPNLSGTYLCCCVIDNHRMYRDRLFDAKIGEFKKSDNVTHWAQLIEPPEFYEQTTSKNYKLVEYYPTTFCSWLHKLLHGKHYHKMDNQAYPIAVCMQCNPDLAALFRLRGHKEKLP